MLANNSRHNRAENHRRQGHHHARILADQGLRGDGRREGLRKHAGVDPEQRRLDRGEPERPDEWRDQQGTVNELDRDGRLVPRQRRRWESGGSVVWRAHEGAISRI